MKFLIINLLDCIYDWFIVCSIPCKINELNVCLQLLRKKYWIGWNVWCRFGERCLRQQVPLLAELPARGLF